MVRDLNVDVDQGPVALGYDYGCYDGTGCSKTFKSFIDEKSQDTTDFFMGFLDKENVANSEAATKG
jgi:hypothetical protein